MRYLERARGEHVRRVHLGVEREVVASRDGRFLAWAVADDSIRTPDPAHPRATRSGSRVRLYDVAAARLIDRFPGSPGEGSVQAVLPDGKEKLLLNQPRYDFAWQREYHFDNLL